MRLLSLIKELGFLFRRETLPSDQEFYQLVQSSFGFLIADYQFTIYKKEHFSMYTIVYYFKEGIVISVHFEVREREVHVSFYKGTSKDISEYGFGMPRFSLEQLLAVRAPNYKLPKPSERYKMTMNAYLQLCLDTAAEALKKFANDVFEGDFSKIDQQLSEKRNK